MCARRQWNWRTINTLQSLNHVIIIKIKVPVLLLQVTVADFGYSVYAKLGSGHPCLRDEYLSFNDNYMI
jgi:hypothetical protein